MKYVEPGMEIVEVEQNIFMSMSGGDGTTGNGNEVNGGVDWTQP